MSNATDSTDDIGNGISKLNVNTNVSDHTAVTTPLQDEHEASGVGGPSVVTPTKDSKSLSASTDVPAAATPSASDNGTPVTAAVDNANATPSAPDNATPVKTGDATPAPKAEVKRKTSRKLQNVDLVLGDWVAEGGFCSIYEVTSIQDIDSKEWLLESIKPDDSSKRNKRHLKSRTLSGLTGPLSPHKKNHNRGQSTSALVEAPLPPLMKSVQLSVTRSFNITKSGDSAPMTSSSERLDTDNSSQLDNASSRSFGMRKSSASGRATKPSAMAAVFRRSTTHDGISHHAASTPTNNNVNPSFLRESPSRSDNNNNSNNQAGGPSFVLKCLKNPVLQNPQVLDLGLKDMKIEIQMLQRLRHPNIIGLRAYGTMVLDYDTNNNGTPTTKQPRVLKRAPTAYPFLVLDRLGCTLDDKFKFWESKHLQKSTLVGKLVTHRHHSKATFCGHERWKVLCDMTSALAYLHKYRIIYRDVKPENVAFDQNTGTLKLLDFGLAKDLKHVPPTPSGLYRLTGLTGSARYMAPEVAREDEYNETCDVYGLAIVMWQVMALETPYSKFNVSKMFKFVYDCPHVRPPLDEWKHHSDHQQHGLASPTHQLTEDLEWFTKMLSRMWSPLVENRPSMKEVHMVLRNKLEQYEKAASLAEHH
ncbi:MAP kinase-activated protein kinase 2 (Fragment) [Seminavis robusta]|uniref:MAP kinase-activated protein kinase 2 n=1 Tax=Seminavis robusta TaxID=568900 RepID=A0A9N8EL50_9STRA